MPGFSQGCQGLQQTPYQLNHLTRYKHLALLLFSETGSHAAQEQAEGQNDLWLIYFLCMSFACMKHLHHVMLTGAWFEEVSDLWEL